MTSRDLLRTFRLYFSCYCYIKRVVLRGVSAVHQRWKWVSGSWVMALMGQMGHHFCMGHMGRGQGWRIRSVRILFSDRYVRTLTYSILAYVNKNRIRKQTMITEAANWFFATVLINLLFDCVVQNGQFN